MTVLADIRAEIGAGLADIFFDATLIRDTAASAAAAWDSGAVTSVNYPCKAIHEMWAASLMASGLVNIDEVRVLILATSLSVEPKPLDRITIRNETFTIVPMGSGRAPVMTDPAQAVWDCRARK